MSRLLWIALGALGIGLVVLVLRDGAGSTMGLANDDFAELLYLGVLGVVIGAGVLFSGIRFGAAARSLAIWAAIALALVAGYQYRYELQDVASRLTAGLVPGSPVSSVGADGTDLVMLDKMANGHFEVRAIFDGTPVRTLIDTGASSTVLSAEDAARVGYEPGQLDFIVPIMTANGTARAARVTVEELRVGSISRRNLPVLVAEPGRLAQSLLGINFIGTLSGFDMRGERLILRD